MYLREISQILVVVGISSSREEFILTAFRKISISPQPKKYLELSLNSTYLSTKENDESCTKSDGEHPVEPEIEEAASLVCIPQTNYPILPVMTQDEFQSGPKDKMSQYHHDYIKHWFQIKINSMYHSHLQILFISHISKLFIVHAHIPPKVYTLNLCMIIYLYLIRTWLHWKFSFT